MGLLKISYTVSVTFFLWIVLTTIIPNIYPGCIGNEALIDKDGYLGSAYYNSINTPPVINNNLTNSHIVLFTAHPDDESMFFTPTITELTKENYGNTFHLICLSNGGFDGLGDVRERELNRAARLLNIDTVKVLDYVDDIKNYWDTDDIVKTISKEIDILKKQLNIANTSKNNNNDFIILSFDEFGVSNHPNHKSIYLGIKKYHSLTNTRTFTLKSWNLLLKYSGFIFSSIEITFKWLSKCDKINDFLDTHEINFLKDYRVTNSVGIYSDLNTLFLNFTTMTWAHYSQIVWFRWIWIFASKYMNSNELVPIS